MIPPIRICVSVACANPLSLRQDLDALVSAGVDYFHIDVMDGTFVPNFCLGLELMGAIRSAYDTPLDVHLMIERPERYIQRCAASGADVIVIHEEATNHLQRILAQIHQAGARAGVALSPHTPLEVLRYVLDDLDLLLLMTVNPGFSGQKLIPATIGKVKEAREMLDAAGHAEIDIMVDGNVSFENTPQLVAAGANWLVGGSSSIFRGDDIGTGVSRLRQLAEGARAGRGS